MMMTIRCDITFLYPVMPCYRFCVDGPHDDRYGIIVLSLFVSSNSKRSRSFVVVCCFTFVTSSTALSLWVELSCLD